MLYHHRKPWGRLLVQGSLLSATILPLHAAELQVLQNGGPGTFSSIQAAIRIASPSDVVRVGPGTYTEDLDFLGKNLTVISSDGPASTHIEGTGSGPVVSLVSGEPASTTLEGFTIRGGTGAPNLYGDTEGGNILVSGASALLRNLVLESGSAAYGGALAVLDGEVILEDAFLQTSSATYGGGIFLRDAFLDATRIQVLSNDAEVGGGIRAYDGNLLLSNSLIAANVSTGASAGGIDLRYCDALSMLINNTVLENAGSAAGGIQLYATDAQLINNIVAYNALGAGVHAYGATNTPSVVYNDVYGNAGGNYSGELSELTGQDGNLSVAPEFVSYVANGRFDDDYLALMPGSALFNAGVPSVLDADGSRSDMGMYGGPEADEAVYQDTDGDGMFDAWEALHGLDSTQDDSQGDLDQDGLSNLEEYSLGTDPEQADTDADGVSDAEEQQGGMNPTDPGDNRPVANAGADLSAEVQGTVTLDGAGSTDPNGDVLGYTWRLVQAPAGSAWVAETVLGQAALQSFSPDVSGVFTLGLVVQDGRVSSLEDTVEVRGLGTLRVPEDFATIQAAIAAAKDGELVLVGPGTYVGPLDFSGKAITVRGLEGAEATHLVGSTAPLVKFLSGEGETSVLEGFTISGATSSAVWIEDAHPLLRDLILRNNRGYDGGAISVTNGGLTLIDSLLESNGASDMAGALYASNSALKLLRNEFRGNNAAYDGGALWVDESEVLFANNIVRDNFQYDYDSAAVEIWDSYGIEIYNNLFLENDGNEVADLYINHGSAAVRNNLFAGSTQEISVWNSSSISFAYNDVIGYGQNPLSNTDAGIGELGNISVAPQFVAYSQDGDSTNDDFALMPGSPCIDAGDPASEFDDLDFTRNDQGIYGGPHAGMLTDADQDGMPDGWEQRYGLDTSRDDSMEDPDGDGLVNLEELNHATNPSLADTDVDGISDGQEVATGFDPLDPSDNRPVADAGADVSAVFGESLVLEGAASWDPNGDALSHTWRFVALPPNSQLDDSDIQGLADGTARFVPDVRGIYTLGLTVQDGHSSSLEDLVEASSLGTLHVPAEFASISEAIDEAIPGEVVALAAGTYAGRIAIQKSLTLRGEAGAAATILDGLLVGSVVSVEDVTSGSVRLEGLTLQGGAGTLLNQETFGGGLLVIGAQVTVEGCILTGNQAQHGAGAAVLPGSSLDFVDSHVDRNAAAAAGGGIYSEAELSLTRTFVRSNHALRGGGLAQEGGTLEASNSLFQSNEAYGTLSAGGIELTGVDAALTNLVMAGDLGGLAQELKATDGTLILHNAILAGTSGVAVYGAGTLSASIAWSDVYGFRSRYAGTLFDQTGMNGNISEQPRFVGWSQDRNESNDDFHLRVGSPCRNAGDPSSDALDPNGSRNDMGMYGGPEAE